MAFNWVNAAVNRNRIARMKRTIIIWCVIVIADADMTLQNLLSLFILGLILGFVCAQQQSNIRLRFIAGTHSCDFDSDDLLAGERCARTNKMLCAHLFEKSRAANGFVIFECRTSCGWEQSSSFIINMWESRTPRNVFYIQFHNIDFDSIIMYRRVLNGVLVKTLTNPKAIQIDAYLHRFITHVSPAAVSRLARNRRL